MLFVTVLFALADLIHHNADQRSLNWAQRLSPWDARYPILLADLDPAGPHRHLTHAHTLRPRYTPVSIRLALEAEALGDFDAAERRLNEAARLDRTFLPLWTLANFHFRHSNPDRFWTHTRQAITIYEGDLTGVFRLCLRLDPDVESLLSRFPALRPSARLDLFRVLLATAGRHDAARIAKAVAQDRLPGARELLLEACHQSVIARETASLTFWNAATEARIFDGDPLSPRGGRSINNGGFSKPPTGACFDWKLPAADGFRPHAGPPAGFQAEFSGRQAESITILEQWLPLDPDAHYELAWTAQTDLGPTASEFEWRLDGQPLAPIGAMRASFPAAGRAIAHLTLGTHRGPGTTRPAGKLQLTQVTLKPL